ncbi:hypothetical protein L6452_43788 [Arctium lappa]|uniref:Uncharacterized protein n=1 Tax=Arctium lappa TaxID=4217 RepID=A0ACB8XDE3_ARCLA|nr:hypothetical protein L6452_43788 [Arctium lappa]
MQLPFRYERLHSSYSSTQSKFLSNDYFQSYSKEELEAKTVEGKIYVAPIVLESKIYKIENTLVEERVLTELEKMVFSTIFMNTDFSKTSKASKSHDITGLFDEEFDFLKSDGCFNDCVDQFDFNAKLPDHSQFIINSNGLPSVYEKGESLTKVDKSVSLSTKDVKDVIRKKTEVKSEWRPKKKIGESAKSCSESSCNRMTDSKTDVTRLMWYLDSGCSKHMTGQKDILSNYTEKFCGNVRFGNDQFSPILGYGDVVQDNVTIKKVSYVEGLGHNLFSIGQFCDKDLKLVTGNLVKGLPELKYVKEHLCAACEIGKMKRAAHKSKTEPSTSSTLELLHMDRCGPIRTQSINDKKYVLVIVDNYSRYNWVKFLRSKDETPDFIITFLKITQVNLQKPSQQNGVVERHNRMEL